MFSSSTPPSQAGWKGWGQLNELILKGLKGAAAYRDQAMDLISPEQLNELSLPQLWELVFAVLNALAAKLDPTRHQPVAESSSSHASRRLVL